ncbi:MAG TPA: hypothetical protein VF476_01110 [Chitinophagaceae bacterium]
MILLHTYNSGVSVVFYFGSLAIAVFITALVTMYLMSQKRK